MARKTEGRNVPVHVPDANPWIDDPQHDGDEEYDPEEDSDE
jgi:hypothetical protein